MTNKDNRVMRLHLKKCLKRGFKVLLLKENDKRPLSKGVYDATNDSRIIDTWPNEYSSANIAIATGEASGIFVVDVDIKNGKDGEGSLNALQKICGDFNTYSCVTPSGGKHFYFKYPASGAIGNPTDILPGIDIRGDGGYVAAEPSVIDGAEYQVVDLNANIVEAPLPLLILLKHGKRAAFPINTKQGGRNPAIFEYAKQLRDLHIPREDAEILVLAMAAVCEPAYPKHELLPTFRSAYDNQGNGSAASINANDFSQIVERMNQEYAVTWAGGKCVILKETINPNTKKQELDFSSHADFMKFFMNTVVFIGKRKTTHAKIWLEHPQCRKYERVIFSPKHNHEGYYNFWRGYGCEAKKGDCSLYLDHVKNIICSGKKDIYKWVIAWMADAIQKPDQRPGTAIVLRGKQGTGKGEFVKHFGALFGQHFLQIVHSRQLTGHFNAHLINVCLVFADEAIWGGNRAEEGALKALVTEDKLAIEPKGKDVISMPNNVRVILASNNDWPAPAGMEERRFLFLDINDLKMRDTKYFEAMSKQMNNGGREALLYFLQHHDYSDVNLRIIPQTDALFEMKIQTMTQMQRFWLDKLQAGSIRDDDDDWPDEIAAGDLYREFCKHASSSRSHSRSGQTQFGIQFKKLVPNLEIAMHKTTVAMVEKQVKYYVLPTLRQCRKHFARITQTDIKWETVGSCAITTTLDEK